MFVLLDNMAKALTVIFLQHGALQSSIEIESQPVGPAVQAHILNKMTFVFDSSVLSWCSVHDCPAQLVGGSVAIVSYILRLLRSSSFSYARELVPFQVACS